MVERTILSLCETNELIQILKNRFLNNMHRHSSLDWNDVEKRLRLNPEKVYKIKQMEDSGGEPDVVRRVQETAAFVFFDCSKESPAGRRSLCYDKQALDSRKQNKPIDSAKNIAEKMGVSLLKIEDYYHLQTLGNFDEKTSSWLETPENIRILGGALFGDHRYDQTFIYHNGADSYYSARGFRAYIIV